MAKKTIDRYGIVQKKLEDFTQFRERRFRGTYLAILTLRELGLEDRLEGVIYKIALPELVSFGRIYDSYRHAWGDVTREIKSLRGSDYGDSEELEQEEEINLGYEVGYNQYIKLSSKLK